MPLYTYLNTCVLMYTYTNMCARFVYVCMCLLHMIMCIRVYLYIYITLPWYIYTATPPSLPPSHLSLPFQRKNSLSNPPSVQYALQPHSPPPTPWSSDLFDCHVSFKLLGACLLSCLRIVESSSTNDCQQCLPQFGGSSNARGLVVCARSTHVKNSICAD